MIIIFQQEFLITANLPFSEKQKIIIVLLASASVTCYQEKKLECGNKHVSSFKLHFFYSINIKGKKTLHKLTNASIVWIHILLEE